MKHKIPYISILFILSIFTESAHARCAVATASATSQVYLLNTIGGAPSVVPLPSPVDVEVMRYNGERYVGVARRLSGVRSYLSIDQDNVLSMLPSSNLPTGFSNNMSLAMDFYKKFTLIGMQWGSPSVIQVLAIQNYDPTDDKLRTLHEFSGPNGMAHYAFVMNDHYYAFLGGVDLVYDIDIVTKATSSGTRPPAILTSQNVDTLRAMEPAHPFGRVWVSSAFGTDLKLLSCPVGGAPSSWLCDSMTVLSSTESVRKIESVNNDLVAFVHTSSQGALTLSTFSYGSTATDLTLLGVRDLISDTGITSHQDLLMDIDSNGSIWVNTRDATGRQGLARYGNSNEPPVESGFFPAGERITAITCDTI